VAYPRNCWYVIAWDHEVPAQGLFSRTVLNEGILLYRTRDGEVVALRDRCCHRLAPLSKGRQEGDCVRCGYHGLLFDRTGRCVEVPGSETVPPKAHVRRYPVRIKNKWVFVWMGDPALADPAELPDNFSCDHPDWRYRPGYLHYETPQALICDNLLDFSHLSYVHEKTLGGSPAIAQAKPTIEPMPRGIRVSRHIADVPPPPFYHSLRSFPGNIDRWFIYDFVMPGTLLMHSGGRPVEDAPDDLRRAIRHHSCQTVTPETDGTSHYFFQQSRFVGPGGVEGNERYVDNLYDSLVVAFEEDRAMITAQAREIARDPGAQMLPLALDAAVVRFRRIVDQAVAAEAGSAFATTDGEGRVDLATRPS
jgi:phenylpropionate dioxygenase-like ring-hydroxylating dioxygenase large terminal subunit